MAFGGTSEFCGLRLNSALDYMGTLLSIVKKADCGKQIRGYH